jgi:hypothetical protein
MTTVADVLADALPPEQDYIILGGMTSPGRAMPIGAGSPRRWDTPPGYGLEGSFSVYLGDKLPAFDVIIDIWKKEQWAEWNVFAKAVLGKPKSRFAPGLDIKHPLVNRAPLNIKSVIVEDVTQFEQDETGLWTCRIKLVEWRKAKPALSKPIATIPNAAAPVPTAQDKADAQIQALTAEHRALAAAAAAP